MTIVVFIFGLLVAALGVPGMLPWLHRHWSHRRKAIDEPLDDYIAGLPKIDPRALVPPPSPSGVVRPPGPSPIPTLIDPRQLPLASGRARPRVNAARTAGRRD